MSHINWLILKKDNIIIFDIETKYQYCLLYTSDAADE